MHRPFPYCQVVGGEECHRVARAATARPFSTAWTMADCGTSIRTGGLPASRQIARFHAVRVNGPTSWTAFPDTVHFIDDQIAEGDKVVTRLRGRATFRGEFLGIPPNGNVVEMSGIAIHHLVDGKLVEHWAITDLQSFLQQLQAPPA